MKLQSFDNNVGSAHLVPLKFREPKKEVFNTINHTDRNENFNNNHFKINKKQSMQSYVSSSMVPNFKSGKLVSNFASISAS